MNYKSLLALTRSALLVLHRMTASAPFPVVEALAAILAVLALVSLARVIREAIRSRSAGPLARWARALPSALLILLGLLAVLWGPACAVPVKPIPIPDAPRLARLCENLINALDASPSAFPTPALALARASAAAGMPGCVVKAVRCPGWMRAAHICGLFVPLTGEVLADATVSAPLIPFTAVHELMHLSGIADEGAANIAAWERCIAAGGPFADSARLWALRYAMGLLRREDEAVWRFMRQKMKGALLRTFLECGGEAEVDGPGNYAALVGYLSIVIH